MVFIAPQPSVSRDRGSSCLFIELRPQTQVNGDAPEEAEDAPDLQEVRWRPKGPGDVEQEEHTHLGPDWQPDLLQDSQGKATLNGCNFHEAKSLVSVSVFACCKNIATLLGRRYINFKREKRKYRKTDKNNATMLSQMEIKILPNRVGNF